MFHNYYFAISSNSNKIDLLGDIYAHPVFYVLSSTYIFQLCVSHNRRAKFKGLYKIYEYTLAMENAVT